MIKAGQRPAFIMAWAAGFEWGMVRGAQPLAFLGVTASEVSARGAEAPMGSGATESLRTPTMIKSSVYPKVFLFKRKPPPSSVAGGRANRCWFRAGVGGRARQRLVEEL